MSESENEKDIEETNAGVKKKGNWKEISEFGEEVEDAIDGSADEESLERFGSWRPKVEESEKDVKKKTVDEAVLGERNLEEQSDGVAEELKNASGKVAKAGKKAAKKETPETEIVEASESIAKPFYSSIAKFFRKVESKVYSWFALRFNPYYFDTEDLSVDMKHKKNGEFEMDVAVPADETRKELKDNLRQDNE
jgi:hypothetical protein